jgi:type I restriction enzyme R subunit
MAAYTGYLEVGGIRYEDKDLNGFKDKEIPSRLADEDITSLHMRNLLIVADKFQTGFDEPLLCSMYLDKKVKGISAVQTLSRLNRIRFQGDKENVAVIDFEDNEAEITLAFEKYHVESKVKDYTTLLNLTQSAIAIYQHGFYNSPDIDEYYDAQLKSKSNASSATTMSNIINKVLDMVELHQESSDEEVRDLFATFKNEISNYVEDFIFVSQFKQIVDPNLRGLFIFNKLLLNLIKGNKNTYGSQWLEDLSVEIEKTLVSEKNLSGLADADKSLDSGSRRGTNAVNPNIVDKPTTIDELIKEYNEKLKVLILNLVGKTNYTAIDIERFDFSVFAEIINEAALNPQLIQIAKTISSQRFVNSSTVPIASGIILKVLVDNKVKNKNNNDYINLVALYNDQEEFRKRIQRYVLSSTYQLLLKNRTSALSMISELENND